MPVARPAALIIGADSVVRATRPLRAAVELIASAMAINAGVITPTINLDHPGEGCDLDYVPNVAREARVDRVMSNSFGFGGHNASLLIGRYSPGGQT